MFHYSCVKNLLANQWNWHNIEFNYLNCPECKKPIEADHCPKLDEMLKKEQKLQDNVRKKAMKQAKEQGLDKDPRVTDPGSEFHNNLMGYALHKLSYFMCFKCKKPYFGGLKECGGDMDQERNEVEFICSKCDDDKIEECQKHGKMYNVNKCQYCCSMAIWWCGTTPFCEPCHNDAGALMNGRRDVTKCLGVKDCSFGAKHKDNPSKFSLGCSVCHNNLKGFR